MGILFLALFVLLGAPVLALEVGSAIPSFTVTSPDGETLSSSDLLGKLSVVFYDTRHTASWNNELKYAIKDLRQAHLPLLGNLRVIQIIDASSANVFTRTIWKRKLKENARKHNVTIYADWSGAMRRDFGFNPRESNVLVVDASGIVRYIFAGKVSESEKEKLFALLLALGERKNP